MSAVDGANPAMAQLKKLVKTASGFKSFGGMIVQFVQNSQFFADAVALAAKGIRAVQAFVGEKIMPIIEWFHDILISVVLKVREIESWIRGKAAWIDSLQDDEDDSYFPKTLKPCGSDRPCLRQHRAPDKDNFYRNFLFPFRYAYAAYATVYLG